MYNTTPLPIINSPPQFYSSKPSYPMENLSQSLSYNYLKYAKDAMKYGNLNTIFSNPLPFHPYHSPHQMSLDPDPYHQLYGREGMVYRRLQNDNLIPSYTLPRIDHNNKEEIRDGEIVHFPNNSLIPLSHVNHYLKRNKKKDTKENPEQSLKFSVNTNNMIEMFRKMNMARRKNSKKWAFVRAIVSFITLYKNLVKYTKVSLDIKGNKFIHIQAAKEALNEIRTFILPSLGNLERFCVQFFHSTIRYNTLDIEKQQNSVFIVKSFIHQLFSDLTSAYARNDDIPGKIRKLFRMYISEGVVLPYGFLSTFEFNRLEFDRKVRLYKMNRERRGMMVCFILLYRVLLIDIFKRHYSYFPQIQAMEPNEKKMEEELSRRVHRGARRVGGEGLDNENNRSRSKRIEEREESYLRRDSHREKERRRERDDRREDYRRRDYKRDYDKENSRSLSRRKEENSRRRNNHRNNIYREENEQLDYDNNNEKDSIMREKTGKKKSKNNRNKLSDKKFQRMNSIKLPPPNPPQRSKTQHPRGKKQNSNREEEQEEQDDLNNHLERRQRNDHQDRRKSRSKSRPNNDYNDQDRRSKSKSRPNNDYNDQDRSRKNESHEQRHRNESQDRRHRLESYDRRQRNNLDNHSNLRSEINYILPEIPNKSQTRRNKIDDTILDGDLGDRKYMRRRNELDDEEERMRARERVKLRPNGMREAILKEKKKKLRDKITHNFNFLINVLHHIFYTTFLENVDRYTDEFKEKHCYNLLVYKKEGTPYNKSDEIELIKGVVLNTKVTDDFIRQNDRWIQMYKLNTFQFCSDFARKAMKE